jgi:hypothetical protein
VNASTTTEKVAGSNLTAIAEYTETAAALADLRQRHEGVVYDVTQPKQMKAAKEARRELRDLRVALEKKRQELKAPVLERGRLLDSEAKRITEELVALEEPIDNQIKAEEARVEEERLRKLEEERQRVEAIQARIAEIRNLPGTLIGKPSVILQGKLERLRNEPPVEEEFAEHFLAARDAHTAAIARIEQQLQAQLDHEAEQKRIQEERAELERMRQENERLQREAQERAAADARRERERVEAIRARIDGIAAMARNLDGMTTTEIVETRRVLQTMHPDNSSVDFAEFQDQALEAWDAAEATLSQTMERREQQEQAARQRAAEEQARREEEARQRAEEEARLQAERERLAEEQRRLDEEAQRLQRERHEVARKAEAERRANLTLRAAAQAIVDYFPNEPADAQLATLLVDLHTALANDAAEVKPARGKKAANA